MWNVIPNSKFSLFTIDSEMHYFLKQINIWLYPLPILGKSSFARQV